MYSIPSCPRVSGAWKGSSTTKIYDWIGWTNRPKIEDFVNWCTNDIWLNWWTNEGVQIDTNEYSWYGQRRENVLHEIPCRTSRFLNSFYPDTIRSWNNIGYEFRNWYMIELMNKITVQIDAQMIYDCGWNFYFNEGCPLKLPCTNDIWLNWWTNDRCSNWCTTIR